ncbi:zinc alcohol dehydrogenase [Colletotrichum tofieldiae]|nr:zinc alcohol dehydrogenase [Colletotrichum tofieldiae]GKT78114.1 zinc alcohol dehydrogenase [Colletotrichum tofieldiae]
MATSRAWTFAARGSPRSVLSLASRPAPTLPPAPLLLAKAKPVPDAEDGNEWLLVKVAYAALNPGGRFYITMLPGFARAETAVPELDLSGTVTDVWGPASAPGPALGPGAAAASSPGTPESASPTAIAATKHTHTGRFVKGDRIAAFIPVSYGWPTGTGALAEHVLLPARYVVPVPPHVSLRDASSVLTAGCTAAMTLRAAAPKKGGRVLVNGASGGVGSLAVQMARAAVGPEGYVVGVCSGRNLDMVRGLGADDVVDYTASPSPVSEALKEKFGGAGKQFDAVVDCIGVQDIYTNCAGYLAPDGVYSAVGIKPATHSYGGFAKAVWLMQMNALWPRSTWLGGTGRRWAATAMMDPGKELMQEVVGMLADGRVKAVVERDIGFEEVVDGYEIVGSGRARGKVVVKVDGE